ncbi:MAG: hypothetical protein GX238_01385 [Epulopiscium sp.]|nr:hypothetical protein [Candidatus Epulonipiscium sp.]
MLDSHMYLEMLQYAKKLSDEVQEVGRIKLYKAFAYLRTGHIQRAEELIKEGRKFDPHALKSPAHIDFRMQK